MALGVVAVLLVAGMAVVLVSWSDTSPDGGDDALPSEAFRHTVHLRGFTGDELVNTCTGALVAPEWVLTVKHCWGGADAFVAIVGIADWTTAAQDPESFVYAANTIERQRVGVDLAMIRLDRPVPAEVGVPIPLFTGDEPAEGTEVSIAGWGERDDGVRPTVLVPFGTTIDADCGEWGDPETSTDFLEAGFQPDITVCTSAIPRGACTGDSGAPVVLDDGGTPRLLGIVAFGSGEGCSVDARLPDGHVAVAPFVDWVEDLAGG
ncbi:MAG: trypsin-like serine protease [Actinomycetota bacterium]